MSLLIDQGDIADAGIDDPVDVKKLLEELESIRAQLDSLSKRVNRTESRVKKFDDIYIRIMQQVEKSAKEFLRLVCTLQNKPVPFISNRDRKKKHL